MMNATTPTVRKLRLALRLLCGALLLCGADRADRVMVAGQWRVIDGQPCGIDLQDLMQRHQAAARRLRDKVLDTVATA